jgi:hypothetical protein
MDEGNCPPTPLLGHQCRYKSMGKLSSVHSHTLFPVTFGSEGGIAPHIAASSTAGIFINLTCGGEQLRIKDQINVQFSLSLARF